jgi:RimJ/RimL family protein N-acetyltransferase
LKERKVELRNVTIDDLSLFEQTHCDPVMMAELGGPLPRERMPEKVRTVAADVEADVSWYFAIIPDVETGVAAGTVCVWAGEHEGEPLNEIGWMVLPAFQGRGIASEAVRQVLDRARTTKRWDVIHAFPGVTNGPSNGICRKLGFSNLGECEVDFADRLLRCNHWRIDLREE